MFRHAQSEKWWARSEERKVSLDLYSWVVEELQEGKQGCRGPLKDREVLATFGGSQGQDPSQGKRKFQKLLL